MKHDPPPSTAARAALAPLVREEIDAETADRLFAIATWSTLVEPGDSVAGRLIAAIGPEAALAEIVGGGRDGIARDAAGLTPREWAEATARWRPRMSQPAVFDALAVAASAGISLVTPGDPGWPRAVDDLGAHAPLCLWVRGDVRVLADGAASVAVVGARAATGYGEHMAVELAAELVGRGVTIVSGAAYGIDGAAHRAALAAGGTTIALLAGGADRAYPTGHTDLLDRIAASGAVVSEVPCGSQPTKWRFLQRNRLIAAMANATVVVEAGWRSGSLNTAGHAAALARPLGAVPGPVTSAASAGCHRLLREFDARCITCADDVIELLGGHPSALFDLPQAPPDFGETRGSGRVDDTTRVLDAMSTRSWRDADEIARRAGIAHSDAVGILGLLSLEGRVVRGDSGWRRASAQSGAR